MQELSKKNALISVIMPAYNAGKTIAKSVNSVLQQDYPNYELIIVNDGSTDDTESICRGILDARIKFVSQKNMGLSGARNKGLLVAKGDYVVFVDSDDWIATNYISLLYNSMIKNGASLVICGMVRESSNSQYLISFNSSLTYTNCFRNKAFLNLFEGGLINSCCNKLYRKDLINNLDLRFSGRILIEDIEFNLNYLCLCDSVNTLVECPYHYIANDASLTTKVSEKMLLNYMDIHILFNSKVSPKYRPLIDRFVYHQYMGIFMKYLDRVSLGIMNKREVYPLLDKYIKNPLIKSSFKSHSSVNIKELFVKKCVQYRLYNFLFFILKYKH